MDNPCAASRKTHAQNVLHHWPAHRQRFETRCLPADGSMPQLAVTLGAMRMYLPSPKIPLCSRISATPPTLIPRGLHGSTEARSSTTKETRLLPLVMFLYLIVVEKMSWLWLPTQKYSPSNSNPTGETSGTPLGDAVAILASLCVFR